ncbi:ankyrin repeat-containing domain protein [Penicillium herquei]|nr:ankyrin repeat-containing domain protein [Penicillium herquei]
MTIPNNPAPSPPLWSLALSSLPAKDQRMFTLPTSPPPDTTRILDEILSALEKQRDRCKRDKWKTIGIGGKELVIRDICSKIAAHVKKFTEVVDIAVQYDPVHAALPWAGVRFLLQLTFENFEAFGAIVEGLEIATRLIARCGILEALMVRYDKAITDAKRNLEQEIVSLYSTVLGFLCKAKKHHDASRLKRALNLISRQSFQESIKEMEAAERKIWAMKGLMDSERVEIMRDDISSMFLTLVSTANGVNNLETRLNNAFDDLDKPLVRIGDQLADLHGALEENQRSELLQWISTIPVQQHYREALTAILPGSGEWLLKSSGFESWRDSSSSETFWLYGIPGCGKTKLAATVIQNLDQRNKGVAQTAPIAHFFCSRNPAEPERCDSQGILQSLAKQLSIVRDGSHIRRPLVEAYQKRKKEAGQIGEGPLPLTVEECIDIICEVGRATPLTIVIDGLDECSSHQREVLLGSLKEIRHRCRDVVKTFVSSRQERDIAVYIGKGEVLEVTPQLNDADLERFVRSRVEGFIKKWCSMHDESAQELQKLEEGITEKLLKSAQGMFIWVTLQLETIGNTERIKDIESIHQALNSLPSTLSESYEVIYRKIQCMGENPRRVAVRTLQWLQCAKRQLSIPEFLAAVCDSTGSISTTEILDYCCNLVVADKISDTLRLAHVSVREFLETADGYPTHEANLNIAQRCLNTYLWGKFDEDSLLNYATKYWPTHVEDLSSSQRSSINESITKFFTEEEHFEDWLECVDSRETVQGPGWSNSLERKLEECLSSPPSALFAASCFGLIEVLELPEVIKELNLEQLNKHNTSGLYLASRWGHTQVARKLLHLGASVDAQGNQYGNALQAACFSGQEDVVKILLQQGASFPQTGQGEYSSPFQAALASGHDHVAQALIDGGLQFTAQNQFDDAMESACFKGNFHIVQQFLDGKCGIFTAQIQPDPLQVALFGYFGNALAAAIAGQNLELVKLVIDAGAKADVRGRFGFPLRAAVIANNIEITSHLLKIGADPNIEDQELGDALQAASTSGNVDIMLLLLDHGASVNGSGGQFLNTLQAACFHGHEQAARLLIERGAVLEPGPAHPHGRYRDALQAAVYAGHESIVEFLLATGARLNPGRFGRVYPSGMSDNPKRIRLPNSRAGAKKLDIPSELGPLEIAARCGNVKLVEYLLNQGAILDVKDASDEDDEYNDGCAYTALQIACFWGHQTVVNCLLDHNADINAVRKTLGTPLQAALESSHFDIADILLSRGAGIDTHWGVFGSCLQVSSERGHFGAVEFLLDRGANIEDEGGENGNALQVACNAGHIEVVQLLLARGANVEAPGKNIGNALQSASGGGHLGIIKLLLGHGIGVDDVEQNTKTALCLAAENGQEGILKYLLEEGAQVNGNATPPPGDSGDERLKRRQSYFVPVPLHIAAAYGHESIISLLLRKGANVHRRGKLRLQGTGHVDEYRFSQEYCTPLFAACFLGHSSCARLLFEHDPLGYAANGTFSSILETSLAHGHKDVITILLQGAVSQGFDAKDIDGAFKYACNLGHSDFVQAVLTHFELNSWPDAFISAVNEGRSSVVAVLLHNGAEINSRDKNGNLALDVAIEKIKRSRNWHWTNNSPNWVEVLGILLREGAETDDLANKIKEISHDIARVANVEVLKTLDARHYDLFVESDLGLRALIWAVRDNDVDKIHYLGTRNVFSGGDVKSAVQASLERQGEGLSTIKAILSLKPSLPAEEVVDEHCDPLVVASREGLVEIVTILLQHIKYGSTVIEAALRAAIHAEQVACTSLILESQAWGSAQIHGLLSRFIVGCFPCKSNRMLDYLFEQGVSPETTDLETGSTLLYIAAMKDDKNRAEALIAHGADFNRQGGKYGTALHAAAAFGSWKTLEFLLLSGADVNAKSDRFDIEVEGGDLGTPLERAEKSGNKIAMRMLMKRLRGDEDNGYSHDDTDEADDDAVDNIKRELGVRVKRTGRNVG